MIYFLSKGRYNMNISNIKTKLISNKKNIIILSSLLIFFAAFFIAFDLERFKAFFEMTDLYSKIENGINYEYISYHSLTYSLLYKLLFYLFFLNDSFTIFTALLDLLFYICIYLLLIIKQKEINNKQFIIYNFSLLILLWTTLFIGTTTMLNLKFILVGVFLIHFGINSDNAKKKYLFTILGLLLSFSLLSIIPIIYHLLKNKKSKEDIVISISILLIQIVLFCIDKSRIEFSFSAVSYLLASTFVPVKFLESKLFYYLGLLMTMTFFVIFLAIFFFIIKKQAKSLYLVTIITLMLYGIFNLFINSNTINTFFVPVICIYVLIFSLSEIFDLFRDSPKINLFNTNPFYFSYKRFIVLIYFICSFIILDVSMIHENEMNDSILYSISDNVNKTDLINPYNKDSFSNYYVNLKEDKSIIIPIKRKGYNLDTIQKLTGFYDYDVYNDCYWTTGYCEAVLYSKHDNILNIVLGCPESFKGKQVKIFLDSNIVYDDVLDEEKTIFLEINCGITLIRFETENTIDEHDVRPLGLMLKKCSLFDDGYNLNKENKCYISSGAFFDESIDGYWLLDNSYFLLYANENTIVNIPIKHIKDFEDKIYSIYINGKLYKTDTINESVNSIYVKIEEAGIYYLKIETNPTFNGSDVRPLGFAIKEINILDSKNINSLNNAILLSGFNDLANGSVWTTGPCELMLYVNALCLNIDFYATSNMFNKNIKIKINDEIIYDSIITVNNNELIIIIPEKYLNNIVSISIETEKYNVPGDERNLSILLTSISFC